MHPKLNIISILLICSGAIAAANGQQQQQQPLAPVPSSPSNSSEPPLSPQQQQHQQQQLLSAPSLQNQLNAIQVQAQRQLGQLNGLVLNAVNSTKYSNVLEAISNVGKVIQQQISAAAASNPNNVNIITAPTSGGAASAYGESANSKKNEYQSIVVTDQGRALVDSNGGQAASLGSASQPGGQQPGAINYREQGEILRLDIVRRAGQLQQVVASSMDLLKNNGDLIVRRLLEQMNVRLDQAKAKADRIINEPATNEVALRALSTINLGLNNLNNIISNIVNRLEAANKENQYQLSGSASSGASMSNMISQRQQGGGGPGAGSPGGNPLPPLLDSNRIRQNLHQLSQQFQSALNGSQLHQQLAALRQRQQQQMALLQLPGANRQATSGGGVGGVGGAPNGQSPSVPVQYSPPIASGAASNKINTDFNKSQ